MTSRREFLAGATSLAASALGCLPSFAAAPLARSEQLDGPCLPPAHSGYDLIQTLAQGGLYTGFPDGTFAGKFPVSRQKFTWTLRSIIAQLPYLEGLGASFLNPRDLEKRQSLRELTRELAAEFAGQGVGPVQLQLGLTRFERLWHSPLPRGVTNPVDLASQVYVSDPLWPVDERARTHGARLAQEEWKRGAACLYVLDLVPYDAELPNAIPLFAVPEAEAVPYDAQLLLGHNAETWRLLRRFGAPRDARLGWTQDLFRLRSLWAQSRKSVIALREKRSHVSPDGQFRFNGTSLSLKHARSREPLTRSCFDTSELCSAHRLLQPFALIWGEPGSGVAYLRCHGPRRERHPARLYAVDLRTGILLNTAVD